MNASWAVRGVGILTAVLVALVAVPAASAASTGVITGLVTSSTTGVPLPSICIDPYTVPYPAGVAPPGAQTASDGTYSLSVPPGTYDLIFEPCGAGPANYVEQFYDGKPGPQTADPVAVAAGQTVSGINASMVPGGSITGTVLDQMTGTPPPQSDVQVLVEVPGFSEAFGDFVGAPGGFIAANGTYTFTGLAPGSYLIYFDANGTIGGIPNPYASAWYPDEPDPGHATRVSVQAGQTTSIGVELLELPGTVTGRVTDSAGAPLAGYYVSAGVVEPDGSIAPVQSALSEGETTTAADGTYTLPGLAAGTWTITAAPSTSPRGLNAYHQSAKVTVTSGATTPNVDFAYCIGAECPPTRLLTLTTRFHDHQLLFAGTISDPSSALVTIILRGRIGGRKIDLRNPNYFVEGGRFSSSLPLPRRDWALRSGRLTIGFSASEAATGGRFILRVPGVFPIQPTPAGRHKKHQHKATSNRHKHRKRHRPLTL